MTRLLLSVVLVVAIAQAMPANPPCPCGPDLSGEWPTGKWESQADGHSGPLSASLEKVSPTQYRATFRGRFFRVIPFRYTTTLDVVAQSPDCVHMAGSHRLPLFGTYSYTATATACEFTARFKAAKDEGVFNLRR